MMTTTILEGLTQRDTLSFILQMIYLLSNIAFFSFPFVLIIFPVHFSKYKWAEVYISAHFAFNVLVK